MRARKSVKKVWCLSFPARPSERSAVTGGSVHVGRQMILDADRVPTSEIFRAILLNAPATQVTVSWLVAILGPRSFGIILLMAGMIAMLPAIGIVGGLIVLGQGFQMMQGRDLPVLPPFIAFRKVHTARISILLARAIPPMVFLEKIVRPRWRTPFLATKRFVGLVVLMLGGTLFIPIPLSNIIPGALITLLAFAYLEEDGILLSIALGGATLSLMVTALEAWAALRGVNFLLRL